MYTDKSKIYTLKL